MLDDLSLNNNHITLCRNSKFGMLFCDLRVRAMVFNATFNIISAILWQ